MAVRVAAQPNNQYSVNASSNGLQTAIDTNRTQTALDILKTGDMLNRPLSNGELPFHYSVRLGKFELVEKILKEFKPVIDKKDSQGLTAADHAMIGNNPKMIALVLGYQIGQAFDTALCKELNTSQKSHLQLMARDVQDLRSDSFFKSVPKLHEAASKGNLEEVKKLINAKDPNPYDDYGMTPLHHAVLAGKKEVAAWLLDQGGAKADIVTKGGRTLLHLASIGGHTDLISYLTDVQKMDTNKTDSKGNRPLHYAMALEDLSAAKALIQKGASPVLASEPPPTQFMLEDQTATPLDALIFLMKERSYTRDPLALTKFHYYAFTAIVHSWLTGGDPVLANLSTYLLAYQNCESSRSRAAFLLSTFGLPTAMMASHHGDLIPSFLPESEESLWIGAINNQGESMPRGKLALYWGYTDAAICCMIAKGAFKSLAGSWKQRTYETFRPLRNLVINTTISAFAINNVVDKISFITKQHQILNAWDEYMNVEGDSFRTSYFREKIGHLNAFWKKYTNSNPSGPNPTSPPGSRGGSHTVDPFCNGKTESECIFETDKEFNFASLQCPDNSSYCTSGDRKQLFPRGKVQSRTAAIFGLKDGYTDKEAKRAIRDGLKKYHTDKVAENCKGCSAEQLEAMRKDFEEKFRILSNAQSVLKA